jgi:hypothetical protein
MEINETNTYGFEQGSVDSGKVVFGGKNNNWGGSMERALEIASFAKKCSGKKNVISSQKRSRVKTASGNVSDHYEGNLSAYAVDIPARGSKGDDLLKCIMSEFNNGSNASYTGNKWLNVTVDGYRYQFGWRVKNHYDHIHVGVKKVGESSKVDDDTEKADKVLFDANSFGEKGDENLNKLLDELKTRGINNPQETLKKWIGNIVKKEMKYKSFKDILDSDEYKQLVKYLEVSEIEQMDEEIQRIKKIIG